MSKKNCILMLLVFLFSGPALAEKNRLADFITIKKEIICHNKDDMIRALLGPDIKERPIWLGVDSVNKTEFVLLVNEQANTFTIIQTAENIACILGIGSGYYQNVLKKSNFEK